MEGGPGIIRRRIRQPVLDRVPMKVIHAAFQIILVAASMLPEPTLPDRPLVMANSGRGRMALLAPSAEIIARKMTL